MLPSREIAEVVGLQAMAWLAANDELLPVFMGATGASTSDFRENLQDPVFQASVLDFLLMDDTWIVQFCDAQELAYDMPMRARAALPGAEQVHWT
ncbi:DUF3572 domain-containing protein [Aestuariicoccus sp. MJ-SS9]|uniref:DUF3572 domain-containing protein n=1 Tax=Aestuariicoccus sp. MJ-SS9 TaxID=3079855 RepID=UPI002906D235|nr:DUF3572 domain-containing protein [Aestuariicoccus sp. MJ-SS9]MDU8909972.1 DUF3572 domain-containing protein [Aestuariicoccus sp. MJ-SS9]